MEQELKPAEVRVLGALIEKQISTPDYYPLTLNALTNACNQKNNRYPVVEMDEKQVVRALDGLRMDHHLSVQVTSTEGRVPKYRHAFNERWHFCAAETALLCELFLRGPQTPGDLRARASRLHPFEDRDQVETTLQQLADRDDGPFVVQLPREPGKREPRWAHLFAGKPEVEICEPEPRAEPVRQRLQEENERLDLLERQVAELNAELAALREQFAHFRAAFE